jgi:hypothetical protein
MRIANIYLADFFELTFFVLPENDIYEMAG